MGEQAAVLVSEGELPVPLGASTASFADMEAFYRSRLWPRPRPGFLRWRRKLAWVRARTSLAYEIYDAPSAVPAVYTDSEAGISPAERQGDRNGDRL